MIITVGHIITEIKTGRKLFVQGVWNNSSSFDFLAMYQDNVDVDSNGNSICSNQGFKFKDEGVVWEKETCQVVI